MTSMICNQIIFLLSIQFHLEYINLDLKNWNGYDYTYLRTKISIFFYSIEAACCDLELKNVANLSCKMHYVYLQNSLCNISSLVQDATVNKIDCVTVLALPCLTSNEDKRIKHLEAN